MGKYSGYIGFATNKEKAKDIWDDVIEEKLYYGDIKSYVPRYAQATTLSGETKFNNIFSIVGNTYAFEHLSDMRYIIWKGNRWIIESATEAYPRIEISIGGLWNGQTPYSE